MDLKQSHATITSEASKKLTDMRKKNRKLRPYDIIMAVIVVALGIVFYFSFDRAIAQSSWIPPFITFSLYISAFFILTLTGGKKKVSIIAICASLLTSLLFTQHLIQIVAIIIAGLLCWRSITLIRDALFSTIKIEVGRALHLGFTSFVLAISIVMSSQYYVKISQYENSALVQKVISSNTTATIDITSKIMSYLRNDNDPTKKSATVDTYLEETILLSKNENEETSSIFDSFTNSIGIDPTLIKETTQAIPELEAQLENSIIEKTRNQISQNIGINLTGSEKITDVLTELAAIKAQNLVEENQALAGAIPIILTIFLFLALISIGSILRFFWIFLVRCVFWLLKFYGVIETIYVKKDVEVIKF